jgi:hypothetical protein
MGFIEGQGRNQGTLFPVALDDLVPADHVSQCVRHVSHSVVILGSKLFHPSVILARLSSLSQRVTVAFYGAGVWSVTEANGLVLFCKLDLC